ncbi:MAG: PorP/SprF family type IX secretion system membrane protein [Muribaculaceae bacterium]|nr:PorP/SprF family type IX secretion system membrane protein [Muribaculaceae bacterium]MDE5594944.1 PorP/SprF family type IX secretion system membrane protein [Muribaculaceae bacterium]
MNRFIIRLSLLIAVLLASFHTAAQTDVQFSQYYEVPSYFNPSAIGLTDFLRIRGGMRMQWVGIDNAPRDFVATADMPLKILGKRFAVGVMFDTDKAGLYSSLNAGAQIGYTRKMFGGNLSAGVQIGFFDQGFKGSKVYIPDDDDYHDSNDDGIPNRDIHGTALDLAFGIWYSHRYFSAGISATHLTSPTVTMNAESASGGQTTEREFQFQARRTLYFTAQSNIPINNTLFEIVPSVLVKSDFSFTTGEATVRCRYDKFLTFGLGYRWRDAVIATVAAEFKNIFIGYSYDYATSAIAKASSGSHEVFAGYRMKIDLSDKNRHRHKNIRIM